jgi:hypothetical protein
LKNGESFDGSSPGAPYTEERPYFEAVKSLEIA